MITIQIFNTKSLLISWAQRDKPIGWTEPYSTARLAQVEATV